jgi:hypothetical protein
VPTGIKIGVWNVPCKVFTSPLLAAHSVDLQWSVYGDFGFVIVPDTVPVVTDLFKLRFVAVISALYHMVKGEMRKR